MQFFIARQIMKRGSYMCIFIHNLSYNGVVLQVAGKIAWCSESPFCIACSRLSDKKGWHKIALSPLSRSLEQATVLHAIPFPHEKDFENVLPYF